MKLAEIATAINKHLKRMEADPEINPYRDQNGSHVKAFFESFAVASGKYVRVTYVSYQGACLLRKDEALEYLVWLNQGNVGKHHKALLKVPA